MKTLCFHIIFYAGLLALAVNEGNSQYTVASQLIITNDAEERIENLFYGVHEYATEGLDTALGEKELPPFLPPQDVIYAFFHIKDTSAGGDFWSYVDYKPLNSEKSSKAEFNLQVQIGSGLTYTLHWATIPSDKVDSAFLIDSYNENIVNVDMMKNNEALITNPFIELLTIVVWYKNPFASSVDNNGNDNGNEYIIRKINDSPDYIIASLIPKGFYCDVYSVLGNHILHYDDENGKISVLMENQPAGCYFFIISDGKKSPLIHKIINLN